MKIDRADAAYVGSNPASNQAVTVRAEGDLGTYSIIASLSSMRIILYDNNASKVVGYVDLTTI